MFNEFLNIDKSVLKNKALMISFTIDTDNIRFGAKTFFRRKRDHANFGISINLFIFDLDFYIYDKRHWNYDQNRWYQKGESVYSMYQNDTSRIDELQDQINRFEDIISYIPKNEIISKMFIQKQLETLRNKLKTENQRNG